jgi:serine protease AprX
MAIMRSKMNAVLRFLLILSIITILSFTSVLPVLASVQNNKPVNDDANLNDEVIEAFDQIIPDTNRIDYQELYQNYLSDRKRPTNVVDDYLNEVISSMDLDEHVEVIIQFIDEITNKDHTRLNDLGFAVIHEFEGIPAVLANGSKEAVLELANEERVYWLEYNEPIEYYMDLSLQVVNATKTWNSIVQDDNGRELTPIDGSGVTVVVLDTGIDAGHPDLDYKEKTISNLKSDFGFGPWVEMENSDTSYGHGTHCAGTVAGNGDASAGARRGVAPGANLIGLSIGDFGVNLANALGGYEWIYANTEPYFGDPNDHNIRVVSNSWGPSASKYDPTDAISQYIDLCTVEKNVVSVFAAGNSGQDDHDGHTVETNPYGSTPMSIMVAAIERDGSGMAYFSSRGEVGLNETWPDVGAPGVNIWSAAARRTYISVMKNVQDWAELDPYYFAISGTSMATPHVAGAVALLFQACPSLKLSYQHDDFSGLDTEEDYAGLGSDWFDSPKTLVHEAELILEASARYLEPKDDNGVPDNNTIGWTGKSDFAQGYGLINVENAVAIALTLNELRTRDFDGDGETDYPNASVHDAIKKYQSIIEPNTKSLETDKLITHWDGDWTRFTNQTTYPNQFLSTDQSHFVYIPEEASQLVLDLHYESIQTSEEFLGVARIRLIIDYDGDGNPDWPTSSTYSNKHSEIDLGSGGFASNRGKLWNFNIEGVGFGLPDAPTGNVIGESYYEITVDYGVDLKLIFDSPPEEVININSSYNINNPKIGALKAGGPTSNYQGGTITIHQSYFNLENVKPQDIPESKDIKELPATPWYVWFLLAMALLVLAVMFYRKYQKEKELQNKK